MFKRWTESILQNVAATVVLAILPGAFVAYLSKISSGWSTPLLLGTLASALASVTLLSLRAQLRMPLKKVTPSVDNIESLVIGWLHNFRLAVKNDPTAETYFRIIATMDSGIQVIIGRPRAAFTNYLIIKSDITPTKEDLEVLNALGARGASDMAVDMNLELGRMLVGYTHIGFPLEPFSVFKRVPITEELSEHLFIGAIESVEASIQLVKAVFVKARNSTIAIAAKRS